MGCGGSSQNQVQPEPQQQEQGGKAGLSEDQKNEIATRALRDALSVAVEYACEKGSDEATWTGRLKITVPIQGKLEKTLKECREWKLPMIGTTIPGVDGLCDTIQKSTEPFEGQFRSAAIEVVRHEGTKEKYLGVVQTITAKTAVKLCRDGGVTACVDFLEQNSVADVKAALSPVVDEVMKGHPLTKAWGLFIDGYNKLASAASAIPKAPKVEPMEFELNQYVMDETLKGLKALMMEKEQEIRKAPGEAVSEAIKQVFGGADPSTWK